MSEYVVCSCRTWSKYRLLTSPQIILSAHFTRISEQQIQISFQRPDFWGHPDRSIHRRFPCAGPNQGPEQQEMSHNLQQNVQKRVFKNYQIFFKPSLLLLIKPFVTHTKEHTWKATWRKKTNKMQQYRWFIVNSGCWLLTLSQHVSGIFMPIFRRKTLVTACGVYFLVVLDVAVCGTVVLCWGCDHCEGCCSVEQQPFDVFRISCSK